MKMKLRNAWILFILLIMPYTILAQAPPLGGATSFALFTSAGAFSNDGATVVTGDIGTNVGAFSGFPPGIVIGQIHVADVVSAAVAPDVDEAYSFLGALTCGEVIGTTLGNVQVLSPNIYCLGAASVLNGDLILDAQCDPDALFIFKIDGALSTNTLSNVILINGAAICNVYWQINGAVSLGVSSIFRGTIIANGAISLLDNASLFGRGLSRAGAIDLHNNVVDINMLPAASIITVDGATTLCEGDSVLLSGNCGGTWNNGETTNTITVLAGGDYFVTNSNTCGSIQSNQVSVTVIAMPTASVISAAGTTMCEGETVVLSGNDGGTWNTGETTASISVSDAGIYSVTNTNTCGSVVSNEIAISINPEPVASLITAAGAVTFCEGESVVLSGNDGGTWSNGETTASITVTESGDYSVTTTNSCGSAVSNQITVTVTPCSGTCDAPVIISVDSLCGNNAIMCWTAVEGATGYIIIWNKLPDTTWIYSSVDASQTCYEFTNNFGDVNELQVAAICASGDTSEYSAVVTWVNYLVCAAPTELISSNITATSATLSWTANADANKYRVLYKGAGAKVIVDVKATTLDITGLAPSTTIKWKVKARCKSCGTSNWGTYSPMQSFTTPAFKLTDVYQPAIASLSIFPNPATSTFTASFNAGFESQLPYTLIVQDMLGRQFILLEGTLNGGLLTEDIRLIEGMASGIYFVVIQTDGKQFRERLVLTGN